MLIRWSACFALLGLVCGGFGGCSDGQQGPSRSMPSSREAFMQENDSGATPSDSPSETTPSAAERGSPGAKQNRKIIYNTSIDLVVDNYQEFETRITQLVDEHDGFVSHAETSRRYSDQQSGTWTVRVPVEQYGDFITSVTALGFAESRKENAQDVTEEFVDIEARIKNKRELEKRIITMLEERTGKLADVLEIERELSRVREEIEVMEGRLRYLSDRTSLATITINCREEQRYVPDTAPTFTSRISRSWRGSLEALTTAGENLLVAFVAAVPWLMVFGIPVALIAVIVRRHRRKAGK